MQNLLTLATIATAAVFAASIVFDFIAGLLALWQTVGTKQPQQLEAIQEVATAPEPIAETEAAPQKVATAMWLVEHMPPTEVWASEMPCVVQLAKARLSLEKKPESAIDYSGWSIRDLKKEAQRRKLGKYSSLTKSQLIERLAA